MERINSASTNDSRETFENFCYFFNFFLNATYRNVFFLFSWKESTQPRRMILAKRLRIFVIFNFFFLIHIEMYIFHGKNQLSLDEWFSQNVWEFLLFFFLNATYRNVRLSFFHGKNQLSLDEWFARIAYCIRKLQLRVVPLGEITLGKFNSIREGKRDKNGMKMYRHSSL